LLIIKGVEYPYRVYEDGRLWSDLKGGFLSVQVNVGGYALYQTTHVLGRAYLAHTLVALMYIGVCPEGYEVNHVDMDKGNNHWSNLKYVTHAYNMYHYRKARQWQSRRRGLRGEVIKGRERAVRCFKGDEDMVFSSVGAFCSHFGTHRKGFNRVVNSVKKVKGWSVRYANAG